jgi:hypothetical protein
LVARLEHSMVDAVIPILMCRCGAAMSGPAHGGRPWTCEKKHAYRVTSSGTSVCATAVRSDRAAGIELNRIYLWRASTDGLPVRPSPH